MGVVSQKLRDSARGQPCALCLPGICQGGTETTVLCHLPSHIGLKGVGMKVPDWWAVYGCHACHAALDQRRLHPSHEAYHCMHALQRTWALWFELGLLSIVGEREPRRKPSSKIMPRKPMTVQP